MSGAEFFFWKARSMLASFDDPAALPTDWTARDRLFEPIEGQKIWRGTLLVWKSAPIEMTEKEKLEEKRPRFGKACRKFGAGGGARATSAAFR
jgi:hypothetical protein